ncbi:Hypothetical predicted protein [Pelobates cultripes]|uniref:Uncharacterized protein n=1 Tax=Pelobates cultripes TaxID=61616 RepID=A0AAD1TG39_PELCU|nr:Hypothetical predicted protein [Pelobates cultripes]
MDDSPPQDQHLQAMINAVVVVHLPQLSKEKRVVPDHLTQFIHFFEYDSTVSISLAMIGHDLRTFG